VRKTPDVFPGIRAVIAEDEPASRLRLRNLLARAPDFRIVAECISGTEAIETVERLHPSVLFLDIQMPGCDGFRVLQALPAARLPVVVFVTAYDRYALRAFEVHAIDYLLKPFDDERFDRALDCVREHLRTRRTLARLQDRLHTLLHRDGAPLASPPRLPGRLPVPVDGDLVFLPLSTITHISAEGAYVRVHTVERTHLVREALTAMERRLPADQFRRVHRSTIVNLDAIETIEPLAHAEGRVRLTTGDYVKTSRTYRAAVTAALLDTPPSPSK
jgi:two-component system, LytTR family, response regulator